MGPDLIGQSQLQISGNGKMFLKKRSKIQTPANERKDRQKERKRLFETYSIKK